MKNYIANIFTKLENIKLRTEKICNTMEKILQSRWDKPLDWLEDAEKLGYPATKDLLKTHNQRFYHPHPTEWFGMELLEYAVAFADEFEVLQDIKGSLEAYRDLCLKTLADVTGRIEILDEEWRRKFANPSDFDDYISWPDFDGFYIELPCRWKFNDEIHKANERVYFDVIGDAAGKRW